MGAQRPESGEQVGRWVVERWIAAGAHADLYRVHRVDLPELVGALKWARGPEGAAALAREAQALGSLDHDGIVRLLDEGDDPVGWLVLTWAEGRPIDALGVLATEQVATVMHGLAEALAHAHERGLAHGDVKPANTRVDRRGRLVLLDLGSAVPASTPTPTASTPRYAPPEWFGAAGVDPRAADVYALGVVLHELCTGERAYGALGVGELARRKRATPLDPTDVDPTLRRLVVDCTAVTPEDRPTAAAVARRLRVLLPRTGEGLISQTAAPSSPVTVDLPSAEARYVIIDELGRGGMGVVQRAWDARLSRYVALKRPPAATLDEARFTREARLLGGLSHPGIVQVLDIGRDAEGLYFTMELVEGVDLGRRLREGPLAPRRAAEVLAELAEAVAHAHAEGLVHRDIKPSNVILDPAGRPRLVDFGLARAPTAELAALTATGELLGTPAYMAPEQARGEPAGPEADVFALGGMLHAMLTGTSPRGEHPPAEVLWRVLEVPIPRLRQLDATLPLDLEAITAWALHDGPARRPSARDLAADLRRYLDGEPVQARPMGLVERTWRWAGRRRAVLGSAAGALAACALLGLGVWTVQAGLEAREDALREQQAAAAWERLRPSLVDVPDEEALDRFLAFVEQPDWQPTRAPVQAWLWWADQLETLEHAPDPRWRDAREDALQATVQAWLVAGPEDRAAVAEALQLRLLGLGRLADAVRAPASLTDDDRARAGLDHQAALVVRDLDGAGQGSGPLAAVARALAPATRTSVAPGRWRVWAADDGPLIGQPDGGGDRVALDRAPDLPERWRRPGHGPHTTFSVVQDQVLHAAFEDAGLPMTRILDAAEGSLMDTLTGVAAERALPDPSHPGSLVLAQAAAPTSLWRTSAGSEPIELWPPLRARGGEVSDLAMGDVDGDGSEEIVVNPGPWGAFEVVVLTPDDDGPHAYRPLATARVGHTPQVVVVPRPGGGAWVGTVTDQAYGSRVAFPEGSPYGTAPGLHLWRVEDGDLQAVHHVPAPGACASSFVGDPIGDGSTVWVAGCDGVMLLVVPTAEESFSVARLAGLQPLAVTDLDGDGDDEIVVSDTDTGAVWTLGSGSERLPRWVAPRPRPLPELPGSASRAAGLGALGLETEAARHALDLAQAAPASERADHTRFAAEALLRDGRVQEATETLQKAALDADLAALHRDQGRRHEAHAHGAGPAPTGTPPWRVDVAGALHPSLEVPTPWAVERHADGLRLHASTASPLLRLPLERDGRLRIEIALTLEDVDWAGSLSIVLQDRPSGEVLAGAYLNGRGGARLTHARISCAPAALRLHREPFEEPLDLRVIVDQTEHGWRCGVDVRGVRTWTPLDTPPGSDALELVIGGSSGDRPVAQVQGTVHAIVVEGAQPGAVATDETARWLATGRYDQALAALGDDGPVAWRALALEESGQTDAAAALVRAWAASDDAAELPHLLRSGRTDWDRALMSLGPRWMSLWTRAYGIATRSHAPRPTTDRLLTRSMPASLAELGLSRPDRVELLLARSGAWLRAQEVGRARRDADLAVSLLTDADPPTLRSRALAAQRSAGSALR